MFFRCFYYNITLDVTTCFDPQGTIIRESNEGNTAYNQIKLLIFVFPCIIIYGFIRTSLMQIV